MNTTTATHNIKKTLLTLGAYLTLLGVVYPIIFTTLVFLELATTGNLGSSISEALL